MTSQDCRKECCFVHTLNNMGYMAEDLDVVQAAFVDFCRNHPDGMHLDIGATFGVATLPVLRAGCRVVSCDLDERHLDVIRQEAPADLLPHLTLKKGHFPKTLRFEPNTFDAILLGMVLHFVPPAEMGEMLWHLREILTEKGRVFVTVSSPYHHPLQSFLPLYEKRRKAGEPWPGHIPDISVYVPHRKGELPAENTVFCPDALKDLFQRHGFSVLQSFSFTRENLPPDLLGDEREYTGLIATRA